MNIFSFMNLQKNINIKMSGYPPPGAPVSGYSQGAGVPPSPYPGGQGAAPGNYPGAPNGVPQGGYPGTQGVPGGYPARPVAGNMVWCGFCIKKSFLNVCSLMFC